jgi:hypothetical protein
MRSEGPITRRSEATLPRTQVDARREVDLLADQLRDDVRLDDVADEVLGVVAETMQPAVASVWIRGREEASG